MEHPQHDHDGMEGCIDACTDCGQVCLASIQHCLTKGGKHATPGHIGLLLDCADICEVSARFMIRGSALHKETCRACALVCAECAESCAAMKDDAEMERCAEACRTCADECREMAGS